MHDFGAGEFIFHWVADGYCKCRAIGRAAFLSYIGASIFCFDEGTP